MNARIINISRHRMGTDGEGVSTLVVFWGCPLNCRYCLNNFCHDPEVPCETMDPEVLADRLLIDEIYYRMSGGGIVFGGGEPLLHAEYIREVIGLLPDDISIRVETSLNVSWKAISALYGLVDEWIIDIKDLNPEIYLRYTGMDNSAVLDNHKKLVEQYRIQRIDPRKHILFRIPYIPNYNTDEDIVKSVDALEGQGRIDRFEYRIMNTGN